MAAKDQPQVEVKSLAELAAWLKANHATSGSVWLVTYKKTSPHHIPWMDVVAELIAWGWIDSAVRGIDDERFKHLISPRSDKSAWSAVNKDIVARLTKEGRMQPPGAEKIAIAKANGMWSFLDDVERLEVPEDLALALGAHRAVWETWPKSIKRAWLEQIKRAVRPDTRAKRIAKCALAAAQNLKNGGL